MFYRLVHAVKSTVSSTLMLMVAHETICLFFIILVCTIQFQNSIGLLNLSIEKDFLVTSKFSLRFASALGIGSQSLVNGMIDGYI